MDEGSPPIEQPQRIPSGVPGLDVVLHGGWFRGGLYMITGTPGTGKTLLGNQFCFSRVAAGERALYVTLLTESHERMLMHLRSMHFFRPEVVGQALQYVSGYPQLKAEGLKGLIVLLSRLLREHRATTLVLDGLLAAEEVSASPLAFREFLNALAAHTALLGCTTLLLAGHPQSIMDPQYALVDGLVVLRMQPVGLQAVRTLEAIKLRGDRHLLGLHPFIISDAGLIISPRLEALHGASALSVPDLERRQESGVPGLDALLGGGLPALSSTLVYGSPGSGKTLLGLHFLAAGARRGEPSLYLGFSESPAQLLLKAARVGLELQPWVEQQRLWLESYSPVEVLTDSLAHELLQRVEAHGVRRLVLDDLEPFTQESLAPHRAVPFINTLMRALSSRGITVVMTYRVHGFFGSTLEVPLEGLEGLVDNVLLLRYVEQRSRVQHVLSVVKMRDSAYRPQQCRFTITSHGFKLTGASTRAERSRQRPRKRSRR
jgi:circadian clock protein KaiC